MINFDKIDAMLITKRENVRHITGFSGSAGVCVIYPNKKYLLTDFRYKEQSQIQATDSEIIIIKDKYCVELKKLLDKNNTKILGFESYDLTYSQYLSFSKICEEFIPYDEFTEDLRLVKTSGEIENITKASDIAGQAFAEVLKFIKPGVSEKDIACELDFLMRKMGASGNSFETIAVAGANSSLVHGVPTNYKIQNGDFLLMDFGCVYNGYCSDMTRTVAVGEISDQKKAIYNTVLKAQLAALDAIKPGVKCSDVDKVARDIISDAGFGDNFGHALGHGVGLEVHEEPRLSVKSDAVLKPGMVVTVEPGIYIEGEFGVRIEDLVVVTDKNHQNLCQKIKKEVIYL